MHIPPVKSLGMEGSRSGRPSAAAASSLPVESSVRKRWREDAEGEARRSMRKTGFGAATMEATAEAMDGPLSLSLSLSLSASSVRLGFWFWTLAVRCEKCLDSDGSVGGLNAGGFLGGGDMA
jgi:hypothetical protein